MDPRLGIEALRRQIDEAQSGRPADYKGWKERTQASVRAVMGGDHPAVKALIDVRYGLMIATSSTPQSDWDRARESGVRSAVAILEGCIRGSPSPVSGTAVTIAKLWTRPHERPRCASRR